MCSWFLGLADFPPKPVEPLRVGVALVRAWGRTDPNISKPTFTSCWRSSAAG